MGSDIPTSAQGHPAFSACTNGLFPACGDRVRMLRQKRHTATDSCRIFTCFPEWLHYTTRPDAMQDGKVEIHEKKLRKVKHSLFTH